MEPWQQAFMMKTKIIELETGYIFNIPDPTQLVLAPDPHWTNVNVLRVRQRAVMGKWRPIWYSATVDQLGLLTGGMFEFGDRDKVKKIEFLEEKAILGTPLEIHRLVTATSKKLKGKIKWWLKYNMLMRIVEDHPRGLISDFDKQTIERYMEKHFPPLVMNALGPLPK